MRPGYRQQVGDIFGAFHVVIDQKESRALLGEEAQGRLRRLFDVGLVRSRGVKLRSQTR
jgi:hypothetical protein